MGEEKTLSKGTTVSYFTGFLNRLGGTLCARKICTISTEILESKLKRGTRT